MSKSKKRYKRHKRRKQRLYDSGIYDCHHILWQKNKWRHGYIYELRNHDYCKIYIPRDTLHHYIHANIVEIPVPKSITAKSALEQLKYLEERGAISYSDSLEKRLTVLIALFECADQETADALKKQLKLVREYEKGP